MAPSCGRGRGVAARPGSSVHVARHADARTRGFSDGAAVRHCDPDAGGVGHRGRLSPGNRGADRYNDPDGGRHGDSHHYGHPHPDADHNPDADSHAHPDSDRDTDADGHAHPDRNPHAVCDPHPYPHS